MRMKVTGVLVLVLLMATIFLGACTPSFTDQAKTAVEKVKKATVAEQELLYDNGKNFLVVNSKAWSVIEAVLQQCRDQHPDKQLIFGGLAAIDEGNSPSVWIAYYENRK